MRESILRMRNDKHEAECHLPQRKQHTDHCQIGNDLQHCLSPIPEEFYNSGRRQPYQANKDIKNAYVFSSGYLQIWIYEVRMQFYE